jgi:hypothetical protein
MESQDTKDDGRFKKRVGLELKLNGGIAFDILEITKEAGEPITKFNSEKIGEIAIGEYCFDSQGVQTFDNGWLRMYVKSLYDPKGHFKAQYWSIVEIVTESELERIKSILTRDCQNLYPIKNISLVKKEGLNPLQYAKRYIEE